MLGAIIGDVVGTRFEFHPIKTKDFKLFSKNECFDKNGELTIGFFSGGSRFSDDTAMTIAVCKALLNCNGDYSTLREKTVECLKFYGKKYPFLGYGLRFNNWLMSKSSEPYNSFGNGSAMRVSPVAYFANSLEELKELSKMVTDVTHNHPEGLKGAEAVAVCIWLALNKKNKEEIKQYVEKHYYSIDFDYNNLVENYKFDETCQGSVPQAIYGFLISNSFEDTLRTVVSMGGDADTMGAIAGAIAEAYYGIPKEIETKVFEYLPQDFIEVIEEFKTHINNNQKGE